MFFCVFYEKNLCFSQIKRTILENKLIDLIEESQYLWDSQMSDYKNVRLKNDKWIDIAKEIGCEDGKILVLKFFCSYFAYDIVSFDNLNTKT